MRIIHWNIKHNSDKDRIISTIKNWVGDGDTVICLQEVTPAAKDTIINGLTEYGFARRSNYAYSLDYRHPSKFDGLNRSLGVLILCSFPMYIIDSNVLHRSPFPDRTIWADILRNGETIRVMSLHSITGCAYSKAKSTQFFSFAEAVDEYKPDIVTTDANEPKIDHYDVSQMVFYDNLDKGAGAGTFFTTMSENSLCDAFIHGYDTESYEPGKYLTSSIKVNRKGFCRYDFMYLNRERFDVSGCQYLYKEGLDGGSDHALIVTDAAIRNDDPRRQEEGLSNDSFYPYNTIQEKQLLKFCKFYGHPEKVSVNGVAGYESKWVHDVINGKGNPLDYVTEYDLHILETFFPEDGVPIGIKAILFNRFCHWSSYSTFDAFKEWYLNSYIGASLK